MLSVLLGAGDTVGVNGPEAAHISRGLMSSGGTIPSEGLIRVCGKSLAERFLIFLFETGFWERAKSPFKKGEIIP